MPVSPEQHRQHMINRIEQILFWQIRQYLEDSYDDGHSTSEHLLIVLILIK